MAKRKGIGIEVSYKTLHKEIGKLNRQLKVVRRKRKLAGMSVVRVDHVLRSLKMVRAATMCQINMLEEF